MCKNKPVYWLSDIYFDHNSTKVRIVDLETGNDLILDIHEKDKISQLYDNFLNKKDINAIRILQR